MPLVRPPFRIGGGFPVLNSALFDGASQLDKTFAGAGDSRQMTISAWLKPDVASTDNTIFGAERSAAANGFRLQIEGASSSQIIIIDRNASTTNMAKRSNAFYRDPTAPLHIVCVIDTDQATAEDRQQVWVNGVRITSWATSIDYPINEDLYWLNTAVPHIVGSAITGGSASDAEGYFSEFVFVDGLALDPTYFGKLDLVTGNWIPKAPVVSAYGTNGFYLKFQNGADLGEDSSGNGNDFTENGTITQSEDTPTNNYCVPNPLNPLLNITATATFSNGNQTVTGAGSGWGGAISTFGVTSGKWAWEVTVTGVGGGWAAGVSSGQYDYLTGVNRRHYQSGSLAYSDGSSKAYGDALVATDVVEVLLDLDVGEIEFKVDGVSQGVAYTDLASALPDGGWFPFSFVHGTGAIATYDFGQNGYTPSDSTYKALSTDNLPAVTGKNINDLLTITLDTEANIVASVAAAHSYSTSVTAYKNRDASETWAWRFSHDASNEFAVSTTATYQANRTLAGSNNWVAYTYNISSTYGTASGAQAHTNGGGDTTVTHNLGEANAVIMLFPRANGEVFVYHPDLTSGKLLYLTGTDAEFASTRIKNVTSNGFDIESAAPTDTYDYLVLTETNLCSIGSYTGNADADGPFVNEMISASWNMSKRAVGGVSNWLINDNGRSTYNVAAEYLTADTSDAEGTGIGVDFVATGTKIRYSTTVINGSGNTYVYLMFGQPTGGSNISEATGR